VRAGRTIKILIGKMPHTNPADQVLQKSLREAASLRRSSWCSRTRRSARMSLRRRVHSS